VIFGYLWSILIQHAPWSLKRSTLSLLEQVYRPVLEQKLLYPAKHRSKWTKINDANHQFVHQNFAWNLNAPVNTFMKTKQICKAKNSYPLLSTNFNRLFLPTLLPASIGVYPNTAVWYLLLLEKERV
jgi:hypothetical protein